MTTSILVTGGTGALGRPVAQRLRDAGASVTVLSRHPRETAEGIRYMAGGLSTDEGIEAAVRGAEVIVHCAGSSKGDEQKTRTLVSAAKDARNWDYRYSWLRDATFTLQAFLLSGYTAEAAGWARWLRRAAAGSPGELQIMYGVGGERRLTEIELGSLPGYQGSKPVRVGNQASTQFQLDVFGEALDTALTAARNALPREVGWDPDLVLAILDHLETVWDEPDNGIWEVRGPRRHFTHSKVMAWVAFDRAIRLAEEHHTLPADRVAQWTRLRDRIHAQVCDKGFDPQINSFTQY